MSYRNWIYWVQSSIKRSFFIVIVAYDFPIWSQGIGALLIQKHWFFPALKPSSLTQSTLQITRQNYEWNIRPLSPRFYAINFFFLSSTASSASPGLEFTKNNNIFWLERWLNSWQLQSGQPVTVQSLESVGRRMYWHFLRWNSFSIRRNRHQPLVRNLQVCFLPLVF